MRVVYHPGAVDDLTTAGRFYESRVSGLGVAFLEEADLSVSQLAKSPRQYAKVRGNIRRCMLHRFPYGVYFRETHNEIRILVIKHHSRHPDYGIDRE